ncbi:MAG: hypothetical protein PUD81_06820, partial [Eggerthellales bacterium]|nr:hypothetical protein [Eggerthellales bacterium]
CKRASGEMFDYQSECHCSKTSAVPIMPPISLITSQNATAPKHEEHTIAYGYEFDYQSECHCSKTVEQISPARERAF